MEISSLGIFKMKEKNEMKHRIEAAKEKRSKLETAGREVRQNL